MQIKAFMTAVSLIFAHAYGQTTQPQNLQKSCLWVEVPELHDAAHAHKTGTRIVYTNPDAPHKQLPRGLFHFQNACALQHNPKRAIQRRPVMAVVDGKKVTLPFVWSETHKKYVRWMPTTMTHPQTGRPVIKDQAHHYIPRPNTPVDPSPKASQIRLEHEKKLKMQHNVVR